MVKKADITNHILVPKHKILNEKDKKKLFEKYNISFKDLPKILLSDPAIDGLNPKVGDIIVIERNSPTAGISEYYRGVIHG